MAVLPELLEELVGVPDDLAADLDEVKQHRAEAVAQLGGFFIVHRRHCNLQRRLAYEAEAVESHGRQPQDKGVCLQVPAGEKLNSHVALEFAVELLAGAVVAVQGGALAHGIRQVGPPAAEFNGGYQQRLPVGKDGALNGLHNHEAAVSGEVGRGPVASDAAADDLSGAHLLGSLIAADAVKKLLQAFLARIALDQILDAKFRKCLDEVA